MLTIENLRRKNFKPEDFFASETAARLKINNYPPKSSELAILTALMSTADMLQEVYEILLIEFLRRQKAGLIKASVKFWIKLNSVYRCLKVNRAVGSKDNSQHTQGLAADLISSFGTPEEIVEFLHSKNFLVDQCFNEGSWTHISRCLPKQVMSKNPNRMMYGYYLLENGERKFRPI